MQPGEPLPSIRPLAEELRVNRNTIAKAYSELENQGVIETIPGVRFTRGSPPFFVTSTQPPQLVSNVPSALCAIGLTMNTQSFSISKSRLRPPRFCGVKSGPSSP